MDITAKVLIGIAIIVWSFYYILRNKGTMLDNMLKKTKEEYEKKQALQERAYQVVDGQADAFETILEGVKAAAKPASATAESASATQEMASAAINTAAGNTGSTGEPGQKTQPPATKTSASDRE